MTYTPSKGEAVQIIVKGGKVLSGTAVRINAKTATVITENGRKCLAPFLWILDPLDEDTTALQAKAIKHGGKIPEFTVGQTVVVDAPHLPKWHGTVLEILAVNRTRYRAKYSGGRVNVPFAMVKAV